MENNKKRKKAWIGALIGGALSILGGVGSSIVSKNAQEKALAKQQREQAKQDTFEMAQNLTAGYGNQDYADEFQKKITFKNGGIAKSKYTDRIKYNKKFACGGRKKANLGADIISNLMGAIGNVSSAAIQASTNNNPIKENISIPNIPKTEIKTPNYQVKEHSNAFSTTNNNYVIDNIMNNKRMFKCGGKKRK